MRKSPNFDTSRLLVIVSDQGAGGKFLTSCLSFSDSVVIPDQTLAQQQLSGELTGHGLQKCLLERLGNQNDKRWRDFGIVDKIFWGFAEIRYYDFDPRCAALLTWGSLIPTLTHHSERWLILMLHSWDVALRVSEIWPNATMLFIDNAQNFMSTYRPHYLYDGIYGGKIDPRINIFWRNCRGTEWPLWPPRSLGEFERLEPWIRQEIKSTFNDEILAYFNDPKLEQLQAQIDREKRRELTQRHRSLVWDADWFCDSQQMVDQMSITYQSLGLDDYDAPLILEFYHGWLTALNASLMHQVTYQRTP
jgi:hypothetical protein